MSLLLVSTAWAQSAPPAIPELGQYPLLQLTASIVALLIFVGSYVFWRRGVQDNRSEPPPPTPINFYADGVMAQVQRALEHIGESLDRGLKFASDASDMEKRWQADIQETRHRVRNEMLERMGNVDMDIKSLEDRVRLIELELAKMSGQREPRGR